MRVGQPVAATGCCQKKDATMLSDLAVLNSSRYRTDVFLATMGSRDVSSLAYTLERLGTRKLFGRNDEVYGDGEKVDYFFKVISGAVRAYEIAFDGRRLVSAFYLPGDIFGFDMSKRHLFSTEAIVETEVLLVKRHTIMLAAEQDIGLAKNLWAVTADELQRAQSHLLMLNKSAAERVAGFLLEMAERIEEDEFELVMSRQDVADYLGLTSEIISRMLTQLQASSTIDLPNCRRIVLRDRPVLRQMLT
jgi:CRP/FNR family nitrogen fixation transcriptional regulator